MLFFLYFFADYGTPYTLISAIATGGVNAVVCDIPARDEGEFNAFPSTAPFTSASLDLYHYWLDFARNNREYLLRTTFLPAPPGPGVIDGTFSVLPSTNKGYIFLFNPNSASMTTPPGLLVADSVNLGLNCTPGLETFALSELWPVPSPEFTTVTCGANFSVAVEGRNARVLSIGPTSTPVFPNQIALLGRAVRHGWKAEMIPLTSGKIGNELLLYIAGIFEDATTPLGVAPCPTSPALYAYVPNSLASRVVGVKVNSSGLLEKIPIDGTSFIMERVEGVGSGSGAVQALGCWPQPRSFYPPPAPLPDFTLFSVSSATSTTPSVAAPTFVHNAPVTGMGFNPSFSGGQLSGTIHVPASVFSQLIQRPYPVPWTSDDMNISWLAPSRLLIYFDGGHSLQPNSILNATLDGSSLPLLPSWSCRTSKRNSCFMGWWADISHVEPDSDHSLVAFLPTMTPGSFNGVYYDNVDSVYSSLPSSL